MAGVVGDLSVAVVPTNAVTDPKQTNLNPVKNQN